MIDESSEKAAEPERLRERHQPVKDTYGEDVCPSCRYWPCDAANLLVQLKDREEKLEEAAFRVSMFDASPAGSLNAKLKREALDILQGRH